MAHALGFGGRSIGGRIGLHGGRGSQWTGERSGWQTTYDVFSPLWFFIEKSYRCCWLGLLALLTHRAQLSNCCCANQNAKPVRRH